MGVKFYGDSCMQELLNYAKLTGPVLSGLSIFVGVIYFILNIKRDRVKQTLDYWEKVNQQLKVEKREFLQDYGTAISSEMAELILNDGDEEVSINRVINIYERLALGINTGAYDLKTLNRLTGQNIINNFNRYEQYIVARREKLGRSFAWKEFEILANKLKKMRR